MDMVAESCATVAIVAARVPDPARRTCGARSAWQPGAKRRERWHCLV